MENNSCIRKVPVVSLCKLDYPVKSSRRKVLFRDHTSMSTQMKEAKISTESTNVQNSRSKSFDPDDLEDVIKAYSIPVSEFRKINCKDTSKESKDETKAKIDSSSTKIKNKKKQRRKCHSSDVKKNKKSQVVNSENSKPHKVRTKARGRKSEDTKHTKTLSNSKLNDVSKKIKSFDLVKCESVKSSEKLERVLNEQKTVVENDYKTITTIGDTIATVITDTIVTTTSGNSSTSTTTTANTTTSAAINTSSSNVVSPVSEKSDFSEDAKTKSPCVNLKIERRIVPINTLWNQNSPQRNLRSKQIIRNKDDYVEEHTESMEQEAIQHTENPKSDICSNEKSVAPYIESRKRKSVLRPSQIIENCENANSKQINRKHERNATQVETTANIVKRRKISKLERKEEDGDVSEVYASLEYLKEDEDVVLLNKAAEKFVVISCEDNVSECQERLKTNITEDRANNELMAYNMLEKSLDNAVSQVERQKIQRKRKNNEEKQHVQTGNKLTEEMRLQVCKNGNIGEIDEKKDEDDNLLDEDFQCFENHSQQEGNPLLFASVAIISKGTPQYRQMWEYSSYIKLPNTMWSLHKEPTGDFMTFIRVSSKCSPVSVTFDKVLSLELNTCPEIFFFGIKVNFPDTKKELRSPEHMSLFLRRIEKVSLCNGIKLTSGEKKQSEKCELYTEKMCKGVFQCKQCIHKQKCIDLEDK